MTPGHQSARQLVYTKLVSVNSSILGGIYNMQFPHRPPRPGVLAALFVLLILVITACGDNEGDDANSDGDESSGEPETINLNDVNTIEQLARLVMSDQDDVLRGHSFEVDAWISPPPETTGVPSTPPEGCPIVPQKQDWLSDEPIETQFEVAGAMLPNDRLAEDVPVLRLVVPYRLGFVDLPERATLRGQVLDEDHAGCPSANSLFVLEEIVQELPADHAEESDQQFDGEWDSLSSDTGAVTLEYPAGWDVEEEDTGVSARYRFTGPDRFRTIRFVVNEGETYWHPDTDGGNPPDVLGGDHQEPVNAGDAAARLIDDRRQTSRGERELRLVFNHQGNTLYLTMIMRDGVELDSESIAVFSEMAERIKFDGDVALSDPMDPVLAASEEIGQGPFLSEADARYVAINASELTRAEPVDARLVSERDARTAVDGVCHNFDGRPSGVWLVTVDGVTPNGRETQRLVYLDAETGDHLCQSDAPGVS